MSTTTGRGRLFFQAVGDPTGPSQFAQKTKNPHIESSLTKNLGIASSQFLDILYPWIGSIKGHYRLVRPGCRGSCGTLVIYKRNQQANVQFCLKTKSRTCVIADLTYIMVISTVWCPPGNDGKTPQIRHLENLESAKKAIFRKSLTKTCVIANFAYIVPWNEYCDRPWPLIFSGRKGPHRSLSISPQNAKSWYWIEPHKKSRTCVIAVFGYIVPLDRVYQRPLSSGSARP